MVLFLDGEVHLSKWLLYKSDFQLKENVTNSSFWQKT